MNIQNAQLQDPKLGGIEDLISKIYTSLHPPAQFRSNIEFYEEEKDMRRDCISYHYSDYQIEIIQYQLELDKIRMNIERERLQKEREKAALQKEREKALQKEREQNLQNDNNQNPQNVNNQNPQNENNQNPLGVVYHFNIKNLLPKSQLLEFTAFVKSQYGCKILKTKASSTKLELHFDLVSLKNSNEQIYVFLGQHKNKFKIRLSNYVLLEEM